MTNTKIHLIIGIDNLLLIVFCDCHGWKFRITNAAAEVFGEGEIFETPEAAEQEARTWINAACGGS